MKMATKKLIERLDFDKSTLLLDGKQHPSALALHSLPESRIKVVGVMTREENRGPFEKDENGGRMIIQYGFDKIFIGTGSCCYGFLMDISRGHPSDHPWSPSVEWSRGRIMTADMCINDILPVEGDYKKNSIFGQGTVLIAGNGCAGAGVRLVHGGYPTYLDILSTKEFNLMVDNNPVRQSLSINPTTGAYEFVVNEWKRRPIPGKERDPMVPSFCLDTNAEETYLDKEPKVVVDITPRLLAVGLDLEKSHKIANSYNRIRK